ncbi:N-acetylglucosamine kinase [Embleya sp. NPDC059237]|uniref:N-acetylglucosamine kinase n=1 Tax=Embleya sp. NPDC059237 TaxID=3346784 RepID=UPI0036BD9FE3
METQYIVGVDAGGTKTRLRLATLQGDTLEDVTHPAGDWTNLDSRGKAVALGASIRALTRSPPIAVGIGAHGCDSDTECAELRTAMEAELAVPVRVVNDAFLLEAAVPAGGPAAGLVVGTGSIAVARDTFGGSLYAGGWGWLVGDPGSAWGTVRDAVGALTRAHDRARTDDPLLPALLAHTGARSLRDVVGTMQSTPPRSWARWAPTVFDAAEAGSPAARTAVLTGADDLTTLVGHLVARGADITRVVAGGSVIVGRPPLAEALRDRLRERLGLPLTVYTGEPVAGAVRMAAPPEPPGTPPRTNTPRYPAPGAPAGGRRTTR